jgi:1-aminocyclopropane-1-carboxylate deaminase/D-cysteine desulfhydrase-like pyridoxal-dependent ACC family enzyme
MICGNSSTRWAKTGWERCLMVRKKAFRSDETVLFWHTGGAPALFAYAKDLI